MTVERAVLALSVDHVRLLDGMKCGRCVDWMELFARRHDVVGWRQCWLRWTVVTVQSWRVVANVAIVAALVRWTRLQALGEAEHLLAGRKCRHDLIHAHQILTADVVFVFDGVELSFEDVILLCQLDDALLQHHVVEAALFARPLSRLVVATSPIPVAVVFLRVGYKLALLAL